MANKVKYGLKCVHFATLSISNTGSITYGTPVSHPGAVNLTLAPEGETEPFYADDIEYYTAIANNGYSGSLEVARLTEWFRENILAEIKDENGILYEDADAELKPFAMLFEVNGDEKETKFVYYYCQPERANNDASTKAGSKTPQTETINIKCLPSPENGIVRAKTGDSVSTTVSAAWYTAVHVKA